jgi:hypothetical protein
MANLFVSYDLADPDKNFEALAAEIQKLGTWGQMQPTLWYIHSRFSAEQASELLAKVITDNDSLVVIDASTNSVNWRNLADELTAPLEASWDKD